MTHYEFGIDTFGDVTLDADGARLSHAQVLRNVVEGDVAERVDAELVVGHGAALHPYAFAWENRPSLDAIPARE